GFLAATAGLRHQTEALDDDLLNLSARKRFCARFSANFSKAAQDLLPAVPFLLFALALQAISLSELLQAVVISAGLLVASVAIQDFRALLGAILIGSVFFFSRRHNFFETILATLFGLHL